MTREGGPPTPSATRVLLVARTLPWHVRGGMEEHAWQLASGLARAGCAVDVFTTSFTGQRTQEVRSGVRIVALPHLPRRHDRLPMWRWWRRFAKACRGEFKAGARGYDFIVSEMVHGRHLLRAAAATGTTTCIVMHGSILQDYEAVTRRALLARVPVWHPRAMAQAAIVARDARRERRALANADAVVAVSPYVASFLAARCGVPVERLRTIGNGVDVPAKLPSRDEARKRLGLPAGRWVLFLGRLEASKGIDRLLALVRNGGRWSLLVAGKGPLDSSVSTAAGDAELAGRVRFLGTVSDEVKWDCFAACDVFALPSAYEGEPISVLEALACARPVATTGPWVARDLLPAVAVGPDVAATLEAAMQRRAEAKGAAARVRSQHTWPMVVRRFLALLEETRARQGRQD